MKKIDDIYFIDNDSQLVEFCQMIEDAKTLALDTEFIREKTYYPKLCLVQIAADGYIACIDPLTINSLDPLLDIIYDPQRIKLFHAARQDLEIFYQLRQALPKPVFDTQIAATLVGLSDQCGYATLVNHFLKIQLDKDQARTDWNQRPLTEKQIHYAANDVRYLMQIYPIIEQQLASQSRLSWLDDDFTSLTSEELYNIDPQTIWQRVSGNTRLKPRQLAILKKLAAWREEVAISHNRPRRWILADDVMTNLAQQAPRNIAQLEKIRGIKPGNVDKYGDQIIKIIFDAINLPEDEWPRLPSWKRASPQQDAIIDLCMAYIRQLAVENNISTGILCSRKEIEKLVLGNRELNLLQGWRKNMIGEPLLNLLDGQCSLSIRDNKLLIQPH